MIMQLIDFRKLSSPAKDAVTKRDQQVELLKQQLGHKYLLSKSMPRVK